MGTSSLDGILLAWKTEKLTTEQAVGQILPLLQELERRVAALEQTSVSFSPPGNRPKRQLNKPA
jgi:hypothetical protein